MIEILSPDSKGVLIYRGITTSLPADAPDGDMYTYNGTAWIMVEGSWKDFKSLIGTVSPEIFQVVPVLPTEGEDNKLYIVPIVSNDIGENEAREYLWIDENGDGMPEWVLIGSFQPLPDMSAYVTQEDITNLETQSIQSDGTNPWVEINSHLDLNGNRIYSAVAPDTVPEGEPQTYSALATKNDLANIEPAGNPYQMMGRTLGKVGENDITGMYTYRGDVSTTLKGFYSLDIREGYTAIEPLYVPTTNLTMYLFTVLDASTAESGVSITLTTSDDPSDQTAVIWSETYVPDKIDDTPIEGSTNLISSGGVYDAIQAGGGGGGGTNVIYMGAPDYANPIDLGFGEVDITGGQADIHDFYTADEDCYLIVYGTTGRIEEGALEYTIDEQPLNWVATDSTSRWQLMSQMLVRISKGQTLGIYARLGASGTFGYHLIKIPILLSPMPWGDPAGWTYVYNNSTTTAQPVGTVITLDSEIPEDATDIMIMAIASNELGANTSLVMDAKTLSPDATAYRTADKWNTFEMVSALSADFGFQLFGQFISRNQIQIIAPTGASVNISGVAWRKIASGGSGGGTGDVTKAYVDAQDASILQQVTEGDATTLQSAKDYADSLIVEGKPVNWEYVYVNPIIGAQPIGTVLDFTSEIPEDATDIMIIGSASNSRGTPTSILMDGKTFNPSDTKYRTSDSWNCVEMATATDGAQFQLFLQFTSRSSATIIDPTGTTAQMLGIAYRKITAGGIEESTVYMGAPDYANAGPITFGDVPTSGANMPVDIWTADEDCYIIISGGTSASETNAIMYYIDRVAVTRDQSMAGPENLTSRAMIRISKGQVLQVSNFIDGTGTFSYSLQKVPIMGIPADGGNVETSPGIQLISRQFGRLWINAFDQVVGTPHVSYKFKGDTRERLYGYIAPTDNSSIPSMDYDVYVPADITMYSADAIQAIIGTMTPEQIADLGVDIDAMLEASDNTGYSFNIPDALFDTGFTISFFKSPIVQPVNASTPPVEEYTEYFYPGANDWDFAYMQTDSSEGVIPRITDFVKKSDIPSMLEDSLDAKADKYILGPKMLTSLAVGQDVGGKFINFDVPSFNYQLDGDEDYNAITFSDGSVLGYSGSSWYYKDSSGDVIYTIVEGGNYWTDSQFTLPEGLTITNIDARWYDSPMAQGHIQADATDTVNTTVDCEYNYNAIQELKGSIGYEMVGRSLSGIEDRVSLQYMFKGDTTTTLKAFYQLTVGGEWAQFPSFVLSGQTMYYADITDNLSAISPSGISIVITESDDPADMTERVWSDNFRTWTFFTKENTMYQNDIAVPNEFSPYGVVKVAPMSEVIAHAQNDQGYWQTLQKVQNLTTANQALLTQQQQTINDLLVRVSALENAPIEAPPTYDMSNPTVLKTPPLIGLLGLEIGGTNEIGDGWTAPSNGLVVVDGASTIGLLTSTWIAVNNEKVDPSNPLAVLTLIGGGSSGQFTVNAGDIITESGMGNVTFYPQDN